MESEKVKAIKKVLEERTQHKPVNCYNGEYVEACGMYCRFYKQFVADMGSKNEQTCKNCIDFTATDEVKEYADILDLINELERENERLRKDNEMLRNAKVVYETVDYCAEDLKKAQDRIDELEKENKKLLDSIETVQKDRCVYKCELTKKHLKQFAERLKEKYGKSCSEYYPLLLELTSEQLDETLEELSKHPKIDASDSDESSDGFMKLIQTVQHNGHVFETEDIVPTAKITE